MGLSKPNCKGPLGLTATSAGTSPAGGSSGERTFGIFNRLAHSSAGPLPVHRPLLGRAVVQLQVLAHQRLRVLILLERRDIVCVLC